MKSQTRAREKLPKIKGYVRFFRLLYISHGWILAALTVVLAAGFVYVETLHPSAVRLVMRLQPVPKIIVNSEFMDGYTGMARLTHTDGRVIYEGRLEGGVVQGRGELYSNGALLYSGEFADAKFNGKGKLFALDGALIYEGGFLENQYFGQGVLYDSGEKLYEGQFESDAPNGLGTAFLDGEKLYEGRFVNGAYEGEGKLYSGGGLLYEGDFSGDVFNGEGKLYNPDYGRLIYEGGFSGGLYSGQGREYSGGGLLYAGGFSDGLYDGAGKLYSDGALKYEGGFSDGLYDGEGKLYEGLSLKYEGGFSGGKYNGDGREFYPDTGFLKYSGRFIDGEYTASGIRYDTKGRPIELPPVKPYELLTMPYFDLIELLRDHELEYKDMELGGSPLVLVESVGWVFKLSKDLKSETPGHVTAAYYCGLDEARGILVGMLRPDITAALGAPVSGQDLSPTGPDILALTISNGYWGRNASSDAVFGTRYQSENYYVTVFFDEVGKSLFFAVSGAPAAMAKG